MQLPPDFSLKAPKTRDPQSPAGALMRLGGGSAPTPAQDAFSPFARRPPRAAAAAAVAEAADVQAASAGPESGVGAVLGAGGATAHLSVLAEYPPEVAAEIRTRQVVGSAQPFSLGGGAATGGSAAMSMLCWAAYGQSLVVWRGGLPNASHRPPPPPADCPGLALLQTNYFTLCIGRLAPPSADCSVSHAALTCALAPLREEGGGGTEAPLPPS